MMSLFRRFALVLLLLPGAVAALAADPIPARLGDSIAQMRKTLEEDAALDDTQRDNLLQKLAQAQADDAKADAHLAEQREWNARAAEARRNITRLEAELDGDPEQAFLQWRKRLQKPGEAKALAEELAELRASAANLTAQLGQTAAELAEADQRPGELIQTLDRARREAAALAAPGELPTRASLPQRVDALLTQAARRERLSLSEMLSAERNALPVRSRSLELQQRSLQRQASLARRKADAIETALAHSASLELSALEARLQEEAAQAAAQPEAVQREAEHNIALGQELAAAQKATHAAGEQLRAAQDRLDENAEALRSTQARLALHAGDEALGLILLNERRRIEEPRQIRQSLLHTRRKLAQAQLRLIDLKEQAERLATPERLANRLLQHDDEAPEAETHATARAQLLNLLATRASLIARLETAERELMRVLTELENAQSQQLEVTSQLAHLLDQELLWYPSHERLSRDWLQRQWAGWRDLFKPSRYATSSRLLLNTLEHNGLFVLAVLTLFGLLLRLAFRLPQRLSDLAQPLLRIRADRYRYTLQALGASLLAAAAWPLPLAMLGWLLRQAGEAGKFSDSLGKAILSLAGALFFFRTLRWLLLENGVAHKHFRWSRPRRDALRSALPWLVLGVLPAQFLLTLAFVRGQEPALDAVSRLMLLLICALLAHVCWRLLAPGALWTSRGHAVAEPSRPRQILRLALPIGFAILALLTLNGYVLTTITLLQALWQSLLLIFVLTLLHGLISRWFLLSERRLALQRLDTRSEPRQDGNATPPATSEEAGSIDPETELISIQSVNQQTRRLLRAFTGALLVLGLYGVWADVLPALDRLDTVSLWSVSGSDAEGKPVLNQISLAAVLGGALTLALTAIAARNLPGLVEIGLLSRIHLNAGARYAITSVSRYLIVIAGVIIGLGLMGVRWSQLQWLAAAFTVGLGFGLQEIFANFVSGIIVLFERPYRVGDKITIGEIEGTVTRIRTRATTLVDSDNREVIVPNKTFITSRFINWTLSDTVTRVGLKLELAQDADPNQVRELLLELARNEPLVLAQPAPSCWFARLSSDSYGFDLSVYVAELGHRMRVRNELNRRLAAALPAAGLATSRPGLLRVELVEQEATTPAGQATSDPATMSG